MDNGTDFASREFVVLLSHHGIQRELTSVNTPTIYLLVDRRLGLVQEVAMAAFLEAERHFSEWLSLRQSASGPKPVCGQTMPST